MLAPSLYDGSTLWATGALLILIFRGREKGDFQDGKEVFFLEGVRRFALFAALHTSLILAAHALAYVLHAASLSFTLTSAAIALTKFLVLLPTFILLPPAIWRRVARAFLPELLACLIVLVTFFPYRIFEMLWPWYSQSMGRTVCSVTSSFISNLVCTSGTIPTLAGPKLEVSIIFACSGIESICLFDLLFGVVVALEWNRCNKGRTLIAYLLGLAVTLIANALRISLLVILGNRGWAEWVMRHHIYASRAFFPLVFFAFLSVTYDWMLGGAEAS